MSKELSSHHFHTDDDINHAVEAFLEVQDATFYREGIQVLQRHWKKCVFSLQGDYVEK